MNANHILFISWQAAMGHVTRDLAIARELRRTNPQVNISWLGNSLSARVIRESGEQLLPETDRVEDYNLAGVHAVSDFSLDLMKYVQEARSLREKNIELLQQILNKYDFDLIIGDEVYELVLAMANDQIRLQCPLVMIEDFIGHQAMEKDLKIRLGVYLYTRKWLKALAKTHSQVTHLFVGESDDVPDERFGFLLPQKKKIAQRYYHFVGHIVRFDPAEYANQDKIRKELGYGEEPLVICATGGTGAGRELLELCGRAYPLIRKEIPDLRMVFVCGELFGLNPPQLPDDAELHSYIPDIYRHYAACDLAVIVGGGTTSIELTALRKPFLFFPLENQFDQQFYVARRIARHGAGIRMDYRQTTPEQLAQAIVENLGRKVETGFIPLDGARKAAEIIAEQLN